MNGMFSFSEMIRRKSGSGPAAPGPEGSPAKDLVRILQRMLDREDELKMDVERKRARLDRRAAYSPAGKVRISHDPAETENSTLELLEAKARLERCIRKRKALQCRLKSLITRIPDEHARRVMALRYIGWKPRSEILSIMGITPHRYEYYRKIGWKTMDMLLKHQAAIPKEESVHAAKTEI